MNPVAEKSQTNEFKVTVNTPPKPAGIIQMPEAKKGGGFFKRAGSWLGVEAVYTPETPKEQKPQDFSIADTATPIDASKPLGVPTGVSNGLEKSYVPQEFQDATQDLNLDPSGSGVSAVPSEDQKFTLNPQAIKPVNSTSAASEAVAPSQVPQQEVPQAFQNATQGVNLDPTAPVPAPAEPAVSVPPVSEVSKAVDESLKDVNLDPTVPPAPAEPVVSTPTTAETPPVSVQPEPLAKDIVEPTNSGVVAPETHEDEGPTAAALEHPAIPAPSSLDSDSNTTLTQEDKKEEPEAEKPVMDLEGASKEEPLLFAEQGAVEGGVLPGADGTLAQSSELSEIEKKELDEKLDITGKAIDAMETQSAKDENSKWIVEEAPKITPAASQERSAMTEEEMKRDSQIKSLLIGSNPTEYLHVINGKLIVDKEALERDKESYLLILADKSPEFRKQLEDSGVQYEHLQAVMKKEMKEDATIS